MPWPHHVSGDGGSWAAHLSAKAVVPAEPSGVGNPTYRPGEGLLHKKLLH